MALREDLWPEWRPSSAKGTQTASLGNEWPTWNPSAKPRLDANLRGLEPFYQGIPDDILEKLAQVKELRGNIPSDIQVDVLSGDYDSALRSIDAILGTTPSGNAVPYWWNDDAGDNTWIGEILDAPKQAPAATVPEAEKPANEVLSKPETATTAPSEENAVGVTGGAQPGPVAVPEGAADWFSDEPSAGLESPGAETGVGGFDFTDARLGADSAYAGMLSDRDLPFAVDELSNMEGSPLAEPSRAAELAVPGSLAGEVDPADFAENEDLTTEVGSQPNAFLSAVMGVPATLAAAAGMLGNALVPAAEAKGRRRGKRPGSKKANTKAARAVARDSIGGRLRGYTQNNAPFALSKFADVLTKMGVEVGPYTDREIRGFVTHDSGPSELKNLLSYLGKYDASRGFTPGYNLVIGPKGNIIVRTLGPVNHARGVNETTIGIAINQDYGQPPTAAQRATLAKLFAAMRAAGLPEPAPHGKATREGQWAGDIWAGATEPGETQIASTTAPTAAFEVVDRAPPGLRSIAPNVPVVRDPLTVASLGPIGASVFNPPAASVPGPGPSGEAGGAGDGLPALFASNDPGFAPGFDPSGGVTTTRGGPEGGAVGGGVPVSSEDFEAQMPNAPMTGAVAEPAPTGFSNGMDAEAEAGVSNASRANDAQAAQNVAQGQAPSPTAQSGPPVSAREAERTMDNVPAPSPAEMPEGVNVISAKEFTDLTGKQLGPMPSEIEDYDASKAMANEPVSRSNTLSGVIEAPAQIAPGWSGFGSTFGIDNTAARATVGQDLSRTATPSITSPQAVASMDAMMTALDPAISNFTDRADLAGQVDLGPRGPAFGTTLSDTDYANLSNPVGAYAQPGLAGFTTGPTFGGAPLGQPAAALSGNVGYGTNAFNEAQPYSSTYSASVANDLAALSESRGFGGVGLGQSATSGIGLDGYRDDEPSFNALDMSNTSWGENSGVAGISTGNDVTSGSDFGGFGGQAGGSASSYGSGGGAFGDGFADPFGGAQDAGWGGGSDFGDFGGGSTSGGGAASDAASHGSSSGYSGGGGDGGYDGGFSGDGNDPDGDGRSDTGL